MPWFGDRGRTQRTAIPIVKCGIPRIDRILNAFCTLRQLSVYLDRCLLHRLPAAASRAAEGVVRYCRAFDLANDFVKKARFA